MRFWIFISLFFFATAGIFSQTNTRQSLIVVHIDANGKQQFKQKIFSYHFLNGSYTGRDELLSVQGKKDGKDYIRTDRGHNTIYKDRYLITGIGNIIDLKDKKVLFDGKASFVRCSNDSAIFYTNDIFKGKFYSVYDFKTNKYGEVKNLLFKPNLGRDIEFDKTVTPFKIMYYPTGKPKVVLLDDAGYGQTSTKDKYVPDPPLFWLDNNNFMYAHFNMNNTELSFYKVNVDSKNSSLIGKVALENELHAAELIMVKSDQFLMRFGTKQINIDLKAEKVTELDYCNPDNGFSYECKKNKYGHIVKLNNKEIGKFQFELSTFVTGNNIAGFVQELVIGPESYQQGIMVWNNTKQKWETVDSDEVLSMVGWIKD